MKTTINKSQFIDAFRKADRFDQFGYDALSLLFDYLDESDEDMELDVIAICCDYAVDTVEHIASGYSLDDKDDALDFLNVNTTVVGICNDGSIVYCSAF